MNANENNLTNSANEDIFNDDIFYKDIFDSKILEDDIFLLDSVKQSSITEPKVILNQQRMNELANKKILLAFEIAVINTLFDSPSSLEQAILLFKASGEIQRWNHFIKWLFNNREDFRIRTDFAKLNFPPLTFEE